ncbi:VOC family protein [Chloroflexota bacterium]
MKVEKLDHIHIYVKDLEKAIKFFEDILGIKFLGTKTWEQYGGGIREAFAPPGILLLEGTNPDSDVTKVIEMRGEGLHGISLKVANIDEGIAELQSKGMRFLNKYEVGRVKEALFHPKDSFGVCIELGEYSGENVFDTGPL